jgi:hypothetical protein
MQFGEQFRCHECPEFRGHDRAERKFLLVAVIHIVRKFGAGNSKRLAEHKESWRNRPRHQWSRYDGTRDDRPRLPADPVRIGIANRDVGISGDPSRDNVFRRHGHATG